MSAMTNLRLSRRPAAHDQGRTDAGAILILALVITTVIILLATALMSLAWTGATSTQRFREQRALRYNAEASLQAAIQFLKANPSACVRTTQGDCSTPVTQLTMVDYTPGSVKSSLEPGSVLKVFYTTNGTESGTIDPADQGQRPRDVTIQVVCQTTRSETRRGLLSCVDNNSATQRIVAQARVRFEINYDPGTAVVATDQTKRAYVPKIQTWWVAS